MKYVKMIVYPIIMVAVGMILFWVIVETTGLLQLLSVAVLFPIIVGLFLLEFMDLKSNIDRLVAVAIMVVEGALLKFLFVWIFNWPWVATNQVNQYPDAGLLSPVFRLYSAVLNLWALAGLSTSFVLTILGLFWIIKIKNKL